MFIKRRLSRLLPLVTVLFACSLISKGATNLLQNGDFSAGNTGFTSGYTYSATSILNADTYTVGNNPANFITPPVASFGDHTTGTGLMMLLNGATTADTVMWEETVPVTQLTAYQLSGWTTTFAGPPAGDPNPAKYEFLVNGTQIGTFNNGSADGAWGNFSASWASASATSADIQIIDTLIVSSGNDTAMDDLSFVAAPEPASLILGGIGTFMLLLRRRVTR